MVIEFGCLDTYLEPQLLCSEMMVDSIGVLWESNSFCFSFSYSMECINCVCAFSYIAQSVVVQLYIYIIYYLLMTVGSTDAARTAHLIIYAG